MTYIKFIIESIIEILIILSVTSLILNFSGYEIIKKNEIKDTINKNNDKIITKGKIPTKNNLPIIKNVTIKNNPNKSNSSKGNKLWIINY